MERCNYLPQRLLERRPLLNARRRSAFTPCSNPGGIERWQMVRIAGLSPQRRRHGAVALADRPALPTAVPFGLGHVLDRVRRCRRDAAGHVGRGLGGAGPTLQGQAESGARRRASSIIVLGLLAPCPVAHDRRDGWRQRAGVGGALLGAAATTLSTGTQLGPQHALA
jgi:hypothetical protein